MSYQGMPMSGNGYGNGYGMPGRYPPQTGQRPYMSSTSPRPADGYPQAVNVQQMQPLQAHNQTAYYQQSQYATYPNVGAQPSYYQAPPPPQPQQYYPQYVEQQQQHIPQFQNAYTPQYDGVNEQAYHSPQTMQQSLPSHLPNQQISHLSTQHQPQPVARGSPSSISRPSPQSMSRPSPQSVPRPSPQFAPGLSPQSVSRPSPQAISRPSPQAVSRPSPQAVSRPSPLSISRPSPQSIPKPSPQSAPKPSPHNAPKPLPKPSQQPHAKVPPHPTPKPPPQSVIEPPITVIQPHKLMISQPQSLVEDISVSMMVEKEPHLLLLTLAEEYIDAAHAVGPKTASTMNLNVVNEYQKLIATGLGCLETVLKNTKLPPRLEAKVRLRYASVLLEETNNFMEAETALSKGIALCEQNRYVDLKYNMQLLLAKAIFQKSPKAALKGLDNNISDAEAYQHHSWVYIFRFLKASLAFNSGRTSDSHVALQNIRSITSLATDRGDKGVLLASSLMEAIAYLHSTTPESQEHLQRALAGAWTYQSDSDTQIPQFIALRHIVDVAASLIYSQPNQTLQKLKAMQMMMDDAYKDTPTWNQSDDSIPIPLSKAQGRARLASQDTRGVLALGEKEEEVLMISFIPKKEVYALSYLLSGVVLTHKNCNDGKAVKYLQRGLSLVSDFRIAGHAPSPIVQIRARSHWLGVIACYFHIYLIFCAAAVTDWETTRLHLQKLENTLQELGGSVEAPLTHFLTYLTGILYQGTGRLADALNQFRDPQLSLPDQNKPPSTPEEQVQRDLAILSALNSLWILQEDPQHDLRQNTAVISRLEPLCTNHANKDLETAFNLVRATIETNPPTPTIKTKNYLRSALEGAKAVTNTQFLCITLNIMCSKYFVGVVGDQAEKSAKAASVQARKAGNKLWISVADGMLAETLETQGKMIEAHEKKTEALKLATVALQ